MGQHVTNPFNKLDLERLTLEEAVAAVDLILFNDQSASGKKERKVTVAKFLEVFFPNYLRTSQLVTETGVLATDFIVFNDVSASEPRERKILISTFLNALMPAYLRLEQLATETTLAGGDFVPFVDVSEAAPKDRKITFTNFIASLLSSVTASVTPTGMVAPYVGQTSPSGWVLASGETIGDAGSGATQRANADTEALFSLLWAEYDNTLLPIQDNTGAPDVRGADAGADFLAGKRLPLPDYRGRVLVGRDNMGGTSANRITNAVAGFNGDELGAAGGSQSITLTEGQLPAHSHDVEIPHDSGSPGTDKVLMDHTQTGVTTVASEPTGSGDAVVIVQPSIVATYIIKL